MLILVRPPANKPKPNTRFLRNIIKDTDNHNAALLAKEASEARARLRTLPGHREEVKKPVGAGDIRRRQLGDIAAILGGGPRKRKRVEETRKDKSRYVNTSSDEERPKEKSRKQSERNRKGREDRYDERRSRDYKSVSRHRRDRSVSGDRKDDWNERRHRDRSRSRSPREHRDRDSKRRERSPRRKRTPSEDRDHNSTHRTRRPSLTRYKISSEKDSSKSEKKTEPKPDYESDPLEDIIGPRPPPQIKIRGRGTAAHGSGIDSRFSANYDPSTDVQLDPDEENDWDQALEALKDRQKWKQQGADRLRAAGFTEEEVSKWESGGEKREADVKWSKQGEGREWDRGKTLGEDGVIQVESSFGRLK